MAKAIHGVVSIFSNEGMFICDKEVCIYTDDTSDNNNLEEFYNSLMNDNNNGILCGVESNTPFIFVVCLSSEQGNNVNLFMPGETYETYPDTLVKLIMNMFKSYPNKVSVHLDSIIRELGGKHPYMRVTKQLIN